ncbi:hypothetical protein N9L62_01910 [Candidatus Actinomarina sp.]|nr:hypothetical protein [Candidatus Actinomarina sp.]
MHSKFGVIIQGPIISYGSGGKNDNPEGFDSTVTIKKNIEIISKHIPINNIVFSGWSTDCGMHIKNIHKIFSTDPYNFDYLNQKRQFYTIKKGFDYLSREDEIQYFVKIRTDQLIPNNFWEWIITSYQKLENQVLVSEFYNDSPFTVGDFILGSSKKNFSNFINSQESNRLSINGSRNMVFKYLRCIYIDLGFQINRNYLLNDLSLFLKFDQMYKSWNSCINSSFFSIPLEIYKDIEWRGLSMDKRFENLQQIFTFKTSYNEKHTFKSFKTEYNRYISFIKIFFRKKLKNSYLKYF